MKHPCRGLSQLDTARYPGYHLAVVKRCARVPIVYGNVAAGRQLFRLVSGLGSMTVERLAAIRGSL